MTLKEQRIEELLSGLDEPQRYAATRMDGKYLLLAGSGSGKSRSIVYRVAYLIEVGVKPWEIVSISFTNKASVELLERIVDLVGEEGHEVNTGTFHSLCTRILMRNQSALNIENMTIISETEVDGIIRDIGSSYGYMKDALVDIKHFIDYCGTNGIYPEDYDEYEIRNKYPADYVNIHEEYTLFKRRVGYVDFDDLLGLTYKLFQSRPDILEEYAKKYKYITIDEAQDNSRMQVLIMKQLASYHGNYMVVGDENQSIYGFRGADVHSFIDMPELDDKIEVIKLEHNYRSSGNIVKASNGVIENNTERLDKIANTRNEDKYPVMIYEADDDFRESEYVVNMIEGLVNSGQYKYEDIGILYRFNFLSLNMSLSLSSAGIPYDVKQGTNFYDNEEIKTIVSYLRLIENPLDDIALEYAINRPKRSIGEATINRVKMYATDINVSLFQVLDNIDEIPKINKPTKQRIKDFRDLIKELTEQSKSNDSILDLVKAIVDKTNIMSQYDMSVSKDIKKIEYISELYNIATNFDAIEHTQDEDSETLLTQFLTATALYAKPDDEEERGKVTLSSVHSSKGLEYKVVFLIGLQQGTFPSYRATSPEELEEERRLFYVGMTRAEELLFLSYNRLEYRYNDYRVSQKSMFLDEIPEEYVRHIGKNAKRKQALKQEG